MYIFLKIIKIAAASGAPSPEPSVVTLVYYYNLIELVSGAKETIKKEQSNCNKCSVLLLPHFCAFFTSSAIDFVGGCARIFLGAGYPNYATA